MICLRYVLLAAALPLLVGCSKSSSSEKKATGPKVELVASVGSCAATIYDRFATEAKGLASSCASLAQTRDAASRDAARASFRKAMAVWQEAELSAFGPLAVSGAPGGLDMRDNIYAWPIASRCAVEQAIVAKAYEGAGFGDSSLVNVRTLQALDYLLFYEGTDNACGTAATINTDGSWAALSADELASRKAAFARVVADDVARRADALVAAFKGSFMPELSTAGSGSKLFSTTAAATNAITDALFYIEKRTREAKVGKVAGIMGCDKASCVDAVELPFSRLSKVAVRANLDGLRSLYLGCKQPAESLGVDRMLRDAGADPVAGRMLSAIDAAIAACDALPDDSLEAALARDPQSLKPLYDAVTHVADELKTEVLSTLSLELPKAVEGDND